MLSQQSHLPLGLHLLFLNYILEAVRRNSFLRHFDVLFIIFLERRFLADRTNGRAIGTVLRLSVCLSVTLCIVAKRCVLEQKLLLRAYLGSRI